MSNLAIWSALCKDARFTMVPAPIPRVQIGHGSYGTGPAYLIGNFIQNGDGLFCLKFIRHRPTRRFRRIAQFFLLLQVIYFDYDPIDLVRKVMPVLVPIVNIIQHFICSFGELSFGWHFEAPIACFLKPFELGSKKPFCLQTKPNTQGPFATSALSCNFKLPEAVCVDCGGDLPLLPRSSFMASNPSAVKWFPHGYRMNRVIAHQL